MRAGSSGRYKLRMQPIVVIEVVLVHAFDIAQRCFSTRGHGTIEPDSHFRRTSGGQVGAKSGGDFDGQLEPPAAHAVFEFFMTAQHGLGMEITRTGILFKDNPGWPCHHG